MPDYNIYLRPNKLAERMAVANFNSYVKQQANKNVAKAKRKFDEDVKDYKVERQYGVPVEQPLQPVNVASLVTPIGDIEEVGDVVESLKNKNYGEAAALAGLTLIPGSFASKARKVVKDVGHDAKYVAKDIFTPFPSKTIADIEERIPALRQENEFGLPTTTFLGNRTYKRTQGYGSDGVTNYKGDITVRKSLSNRNTLGVYFHEQNHRRNRLINDDLATWSDELGYHTLNKKYDSLLPEVAKMRDSGKRTWFTSPEEHESEYLRFLLESDTEDEIFNKMKKRFGYSDETTRDIIQLIKLRNPDTFEPYKLAYNLITNGNAPRLNATKRLINVYGNITPATLALVGLGGLDGYMLHNIINIKLSNKSQKEQNLQKHTDWETKYIGEQGKGNLHRTLYSMGQLSDY